MGGALSAAVGGMKSDKVEDYWNRVVCGVRVKNSTDFKLKTPRYFINWGTMGYPPKDIEARSTGIMVGHQTLDFATGTAGLVTWDICDQNMILVVMWSAPFNFDFYNNYFAIGLKKNFCEVNESVYLDMYEVQRGHNNSWFVRKEIDSAHFDSQPVSIKNGRFCVSGYMEAEHKCYLDIDLTEEKSSKNSSWSAAMPVFAAIPVSKNTKKPSSGSVDNQQLNKFMKSFPDLVSGLEPNIKTLSDHFFSVSLITQDVYEQVIQLNMTTSDKTRMVLLCIKKKIEEDTNSFELFTDVLGEIVSTKVLAKRLKNN